MTSFEISVYQYTVKLSIYILGTYIILQLMWSFLNPINFSTISMVSIVTSYCHSIWTSYVLCLFLWLTNLSFQLLSIIMSKSPSCKHNFSLQCVTVFKSVVIIWYVNWVCCVNRSSSLWICMSDKLWQPKRKEKHFPYKRNWKNYGMLTNIWDSYFLSEKTSISISTLNNIVKTIMSLKKTQICVKGNGLFFWKR